MTAIRHLPVTEFRDSGYLQEVNRRLLHPLGLALEMTVVNPEEGPVVRLNLRSEDVDRIELLAVAVEKDHPELADAMAALRLRLAEAELLEPGDGYLSGVWDYRDDPEGIIFSEPAPDPAKAVRVTDEWVKRSYVREAKLGFIVQPFNP